MIQRSKMFWKNKTLTLMLFLFTTTAFTKDLPLKDLVVISDKAPIELKLMTQHLAKYTTDREDIFKVISYCNLINKDLKTSSKKNVFFMLKAEIYRGILRNQYLQFDNKLQVSSSLLNSIEQKLDKYDIVYSDFSKWIIKSILADLQPYIADNFIDQYQGISRLDIKKQEMVTRLKKVLSYITTWLEKIEKLTPENFNELVKNISMDTLHHISSRTYYFNTFSKIYKQTQETDTFKVPKVKLEITSNEVAKDKDLNESREQAKKDAKKIIEKIDADDMSGASEEIDKLESSTKSSWSPK